MYKTYKAYIGRKTFPDPEEDLELIVAGINEREEKIISTTSIGEGYFVLIITRTKDAT